MILLGGMGKNKRYFVLASKLLIAITILLPSLTLLENAPNV